MPVQRIIRTVEFKIYPSAAQAAALNSWLHECCHIYNRALEQRIKAYRRRKENISYNAQTVLLTAWRARMPSVRAVPAIFARDALRRVDRGFKAFFRRCEEGAKRKGFPRFRSWRRYSSLEYLETRIYRRAGAVYVPGIGEVRARGQDVVGRQRALIRRASGWYAQVLVEGPPLPPTVKPTTPIGIDVGLTSFAVLSNGEPIDNPRWLQRSERKLRIAQRRLSRRVKHSRNHRKSARRVARVHERIAAQRKDFAHQESRKLVDRFDFIAFEKLNIANMVRGNLAKSILDAAWGFFLFCIAYKAASAGKLAVAVSSRGTSQECPQCGVVKPKSLSERTHRCECGLVLDRDYAAALVIEARALRMVGANCLWRAPPLALGIGLAVSGPDETGSPKIATTRR